METEFITVIPAEGFNVLNDLTRKPVPKEGARVRVSSYWDRLIAEGAVTKKSADAPKPADDTKPKEGAK